MLNHLFFSLVHSKIGIYFSVDFVLFQVCYLRFSCNPFCFIREKLDAWLQSHGKTPSRFTHLLMFGKNLSINSHNPQVKGGLGVDELLRQVCHLCSQIRLFPIYHFLRYICVRVCVCFTVW